MDVFTDGACVHNGYPNARAAWAVVFPDHPQYDISGLLEGEQTNNRAEFTAIIRALETTCGPIHVFTDSMLALKIATHQWSAKKNLDLVARLDALTKNRSITWTHVKAHTGKNGYESRWNAVADERATRLLSTSSSDEYPDRTNSQVQ